MPESSKNEFDYAAPGSPHVDLNKMVELEIDIGRKRRLWGWVGYIALFGLVAAALTYVFVRLGTTVKLAIGVVVFMVAYMAFMGAMASRNVEKRDR